MCVCVCVRVRIMWKFYVCLLYFYDCFKCIMYHMLVCVSSSFVYALPVCYYVIMYVFVNLYAVFVPIYLYALFVSICSVFDILRTKTSWSRWSIDYSTRFQRSSSTSRHANDIYHYH